MAGKNREPRTDKEKFEMLQHFQRQDPLHDYLTPYFKEQAQKKELEEMKEREARWKHQLKEGKKLEQAYIEDVQNREAIRKRIAKWARSQQHPAVKADWMSFSDVDEQDFLGVMQTLGSGTSEVTLDQQVKQLEKLNQELGKGNDRLEKRKSRKREWDEIAKSLVASKLARPSTVVDLTKTPRTGGTSDEQYTKDMTKVVETVIGKPISEVSTSDLTEISSLIEFTLHRRDLPEYKNEGGQSRLLKDWKLYKLRNDPERIDKWLVVPGFKDTLIEGYRMHNGDISRTAEYFGEEYSEWFGEWNDRRNLNPAEQPTAEEVALAILPDGIVREWLLDPDSADDAVEKEIQRRVKALIDGICNDETGVTYKDFAKQVFPGRKESEYTGLSKNIFNWHKRGKIAKNNLIPFARATNVSVEFLLGAPVEESQPEPWQPVKNSNVFQFARDVTTSDNKNVLEGISTVPVLDGPDLLDPEAAIEDAREYPEHFQSLATTSELSADAHGHERFAVAITHDWYGDDIKQGDYVFFATDILPDIGDFCFFKQMHLEDTNGKWMLAGGFFSPIGGRPVTNVSEEFFSQMKGVQLQMRKGKENTSDYEMRRADGWKYELIGVAVDLRRPLLTDRLEKTAAYTKRMEKQYDNRSAKKAADKKAEQESLRQDRSNVVGLKSPSESA